MATSAKKQKIHNVVTGPPRGILTAVFCRDSDDFNHSLLRAKNVLGTTVLASASRPVGTVVGGKVTIYVFRDRGWIGVVRHEEHRIRHMLVSARQNFCRHMLRCYFRKPHGLIEGDAESWR